MTTARDFDRELARWLEAQAPVTGPAGLHAAAMVDAAASPQRPGWLVGLRGDAFPARSSRTRVSRRTMVLLFGLLLLIFAAVAIVGGLRASPKPAGANGVIAFSIFENKQRSGQTSFSYLMHADGSGSHRFATGTCPTFSANGAVMAYRSHWAGAELMAARPDGSFVRQLPVSVDGYRDNGYAVSPDGMRVAWVQRSEDMGDRNAMWIAPIAGSAAARLVPMSDFPGESYGMLAWSPDGTTIAFEGRVTREQAEGVSYRRGVYRVDASGGPVRRLTDRPMGWWWPGGVSWSPDGRSLAYLGLPDGVTLPPGPDDGSVGLPPDLFVIGVDGTGDHQVTNTPAFESRPRWSPDGARLGYLSSDDGDAFALTVIPMNGSEPMGPAMRGPASNAFSWSPDGTTLVFTFTDPPTIQSIDAGLERPPTLLVDLRTLPVDPRFPDANGTDYEHCPPSWQWLRP